MTSFHGFGLNEAITRAIAEENYAIATPIQQQTIPIVMSRRDVIGIAQTGTGKTAAFALPLLHSLAADPRPAPRKGCRILVLSPTRELSSQILDSFRTYGRHLRMRTALAIGGVSMGAQVRSLLSGVDVLVATPGRLLDLVKSNAVRLGGVECLVLDEADRMLDMGFIRDIRKIVAHIPIRRQTLMFSATMPQAIAEFAAQMLRDPIKIAVAPVAATADRVAQRVIRVDRSAKPAILIDVLRRETIDRCLVFTRTKYGADKVVRNLRHAGIAADAIHGNKSQGQRERVLAAFRKGEVRTLVATDIAARGIDVDGISHVVNYDVPNVPETYVHRIGRTARAGAKGIAISLCDGEEMAFLRDIEKLIRVAIPMSDRRADQWRPERGSAERGSAERGSAEHGSARHFPAQAKVKAGERHWRHNGQARKQDRHHPPNRSSSGGIGSVAFLNRNRSSQHDGSSPHDGARNRQHRTGYPKGS